MKKNLYLVVLALLSGCTATAGGSQVLSAAQLRERGWELHVSSEVPEPYYVLSGPAQSYKSFRLKERLESGLAEQLAGRPALRKDGKVLRVHLSAAKTGFEEVGAPAPDGRDFPFGSGLEGHPGLPVITKRVELELRASLTRGSEAVTKPIRVEAVEVVDRIHYDPPYSYYYDDIIAVSIAKAVGAIDQFVDASLAEGPRS